MTNLEKVIEFMKACDQEIKTTPEMPSEKIQQLRIALIEEELTELKEAVDAGDLVAVGDALADLLYVVYGAGPAFGLPLDLCFEEVHRSNMTKVVDGKVIRNEAGKVMKPEGYEPPDLHKVIFPDAHVTTR